MSVPELASICASLELLTDTHALVGRIGVRAEGRFVSALARTFPGASIWSQEHTVTVHGATSVRRIPCADATASRLEAGVGKRTSDLELRLTIAPANNKRLSISSAHFDYTESPYAQRILVTSCFAELHGSWTLNQQPRRCDHQC
jgi:hypothetical protein